MAGGGERAADVAVPRLQRGNGRDGLVVGVPQSPPDLRAALRSGQAIRGPEGTGYIAGLGLASRQVDRRPGQPPGLVDRLGLVECRGQCARRRRQVARVQLGTGDGNLGVDPRLCRLEALEMGARAGNIPYPRLGRDQGGERCRPIRRRLDPVGSRQGIRERAGTDLGANGRGERHPALLVVGDAAGHDEGAVEIAAPGLRLGDDRQALPADRLIRDVQSGLGRQGQHAVGLRRLTAVRPAAVAPPRLGRRRPDDSYEKPNRQKPGR